MKSMSIKMKLAFLCTSLMALVIIVGGVQFYSGKVVAEKLDEITHVHMPALKEMSDADMMHDGLRAVAFRAILVSQKGSEDEKRETAEEFKEFSDTIRANLKKIDGLNVRKETHDAISQAGPEIETYIRATEDVVGLSLAGRTETALQKLEDFQKQFKNLEEKLEKLGELIERDAEEVKNESESLSKSLQILSIVIMSVGLLLGAFISVLIVRNLVTGLSSVVNQLQSSSQEVSSASSQSASSATELSEASTQQAASLQQTMASVEEISAMVNQNAESANKAKSAVETNEKAADEGTQSMGEMLRAIDEIKQTNDSILTQMENSNREFGDIVKIISEIGEKTKVINDIVFQTKLLSFNASVEAARAGEHGKGFAVVAEEVGNLAQMSGNAAKQITDMLSDSIKRVNEIGSQTTTRVDQLVEVGKDKITMGQSVAQKCKEALNRISHNAKLVANMVTEITHASKEQAQGIQEINKAIGQLDQVTQQNTGVAQQSSSQAEQLSAEAQNLSEAVRSLVEIMNGSGNSGGSTQGVKHQVAKAKAEKVYHIKDSKKARVSAAAEVNKKAAGSGVVPDSDNPNFEEF